MKAVITFGSNTNAQNFALEITEAGSLVWGSVTLEGNVAVTHAFSGRQEEIEDFAAQHGGDVEWDDE